jgi:tRNA A-37 threonylcarbamoyl transferase component Bud32
MDMQYQQFCLVDPVFYESPRRSASARTGFLAGLEVPEGWQCFPRDTWTVLSPPVADLPPQGWKVHVSATPDNAVEILKAVWGYCVPRHVAFKFLTSRDDLLLRNAKYADRGGSGKFVTIYPKDTEWSLRVLQDLGETLNGYAGPYILSDARWAQGPLYFRYGGFTERHCKLPDGELTPAIVDPEGNLVPDSRQPNFTAPPWVEIPDLLAPFVRARTTPETPDDFPFQIERSLHFSNGGGLYLATDTRTGDHVVLKEARPNAGLDATGVDAVRRLQRERHFLQQLAGTGAVPELLDYVTCWEHHFLVEEYVEGTTLTRAFAQRYPLIDPETSDLELAGYTRWAFDVLDKVSWCLRQLHDAGIAYGDLHPNNIVLRPDGRVTVIDLEAASPLADEARPVLGAPGFIAPDGRAGADADLYAMACLRLSMFLPLTILLPLDPAKAEMLVDSMLRRFPVPASFATQVLDMLRDRRPQSDRPTEGSDQRAANFAAQLEAGTPNWPALRESIRDAILSSATPDRTDRLFPGDIHQFTHSGVGLAYGAAGVLYGLARAGGDRFPGHEKWLLAAVRNGRHDGHVGFYDGLHGVAYVLAELGRLDEARTILDLALTTPVHDLGASLFSGLAGVALNLLYFAELTGEDSLTQRAIEAGRILAESQVFAQGEPGRAGLLRGPSGSALLYLRLFEVTGEPDYLDLAERALDHDIRRCVLLPNGSVQVDEGWRTMPYIASGSLGVGLVLHEFLTHRENEQLAATLAGIRRAAESEFVICPGLFNGRSGFISFLSATCVDDPAESQRIQAVIDRHLRRLAWHIMSYQGNVAFPGDQLLRLSMDFATGSAGVLFALSVALDGRGTLPFFSATGKPAALQPHFTV